MPKAYNTLEDEGKITIFFNTMKYKAYINSELFENCLIDVPFHSLTDKKRKEIAELYYQKHG